MGLIVSPTGLVHAPDDKHNEQCSWPVVPSGRAGPFVLLGLLRSSIPIVQSTPTTAIDCSAIHYVAGSKIAVRPGSKTLARAQVGTLPMLRALW